MYTIDKNLTIENAKIGFRNFSGKEGQFNPAGRRNFCVFFDNETANALKNEGWNIRWLKPKSELANILNDDGSVVRWIEPKSEEDDPVGYLQVAVSFDHIPPKIILVTKKGKTQLDEESIDILDWAEISNVDLVIRPYNWNLPSGKSGVKAYCKTMYVTIAEDDFESKYYDTPDTALGCLINNNTK